MNHTILIAAVEGSETHALRPLLEQQGWLTLAVFSGEAAWKIIREERPDIAIVEVMLPDITGWEVLERVRKTPSFDNYPVMLIYPPNATDEDIFFGWRMTPILSQTKPLELHAIVNFLSRVFAAMDRENQ